MVVDVFKFSPFITIQVLSFEAVNDWAWRSPIPLKSVRGDGPWTIIETNSVEALRVSICLTGLGMNVHDVSMERSREGLESAIT